MEITVFYPNYMRRGGRKMSLRLEETRGASRLCFCVLIFSGSNWFRLEFSRVRWGVWLNGLLRRDLVSVTELPGPFSHTLTWLCSILADVPSWKIAREGFAEGIILSFSSMIIEWFELFRRLVGGSV